MTGLSVETLLKENFKDILGSVYPYKSVDEAGKMFAKLIMSGTVGDILPGKVFPMHNLSSSMHSPLSAETF